MTSWKKLSSVFLVVANLWLWPITVGAQTVAEPPELPELQLASCPELAAIESRDGGVWFPRATSECMLQRLNQLREAVPYIRMLEQRSRLTNERDALQVRRVALAEEQTQVATEALEEAVERARSAEESRDAWYRHPALWFSIGVVITIALEVAAVVAFAELGR